MFMKLFLFAIFCCAVSAFAPSNRLSSKLNVQSKSTLSMSVFDNAVKEWAKTYPAPYSFGWGPTTKAERWNGRHAMFGWVALLVTGYAKGHGLIPNAEQLLDVKEWGTLAYLYGGSISNERAVILIAHLHFLLFSVFGAVAPLSTQDKLWIEDGEEHEPAAGLIPKIVPGLTKEAELLNGRLAMLGIVVLLIVATVNQTPILDVVNTGLGGLLF